MKITVPVAGAPAASTIATKFTAVPYTPAVPSDEARIVADGEMTFWVDNALEVLVA